MTRLLNQEGLLPQARMDEYAIGIIGTGAIGSFVAMALAKMGFKNMVTWDPDKYEEHNAATQMCPIDGVGKRKAIITREMVKQFSGEDIICLSTKAGKGIRTYIEQAYPHKHVIIIFAVDSLDVRKDLADGLRGAYSTKIIDARMGAKTYRVMAFDPYRAGELTDYLATLVPDAEAVQERCGQKSIIYTVLGVAAEVCSFVHHIVMRPHEQDGNNPQYPKPVIFDYGTGTRIQARTQTHPLVTIGEEVAADPF